MNGSFEIGVGLAEQRDIPAVVLRFLAGFIAASLLWAGGIFAQLHGYLDFGLGAVEISGADSEKLQADGRDEKRPTRRKKRTYRGRSRDRHSSVNRRIATNGDSLDENDVRSIDMVGFTGEQQLSTLEIEQGIDRVFGKIRKCLMLAAQEETVRGKIVFGMRISGQGRVTRVNLRGPLFIVKGDAGECLRHSIKSIQYRSFDGPDMVVHYPLTLD